MKDVYKRQGGGPGIRRLYVHDFLIAGTGLSIRSCFGKDRLCDGGESVSYTHLLPAFLSPNVVKVLVDMFHIAGIGSVEDDLKKFGL